MDSIDADDGWKLKLEEMGLKEYVDDFETNGLGHMDLWPTLSDKDLLEMLFFTDAALEIWREHFPMKKKGEEVEPEEKKHVRAEELTPLPGIPEEKGEEKSEKQIKGILHHESKRSKNILDHFLVIR